MHFDCFGDVAGLLQDIGSHTADNSILHAHIELGLQLILAGYIGGFEMRLLPRIKYRPAVKRVYRNVQPLRIAFLLHVAEQGRNADVTWRDCFIEIRAKQNNQSNNDDCNR